MLGLPFRAPRLALAASAGVLAVLVATMPRAIGLFDEGELAVAAYELGLGHTPGQPLHALLGFLFSHLPGLSPATGLALLSALAAALAVLPTIALAESALPEDAPPWIAPLTVALVALHGVLWEPSTRIEVYPLATAFGLLALAQVACTPRSLAVGVLLGLSACANPIVALVCGLACLPFLLVRGSAKRVALVFGGGLLGLLPYAYLAYAAQRASAFVWGGLSTRDELVRYLLGRDYGGNLDASASLRLAHLVDFLDHVAHGRAFVAVLLSALLGLLAMLAGARRLALSLALLLLLLLPALVVASNVVFRPDVPDYLGYFAVGALAAAVAASVAIDAARRRSRLGLLLLVAVALSTLVGSPVAWERSRHDDDVTVRVARAVLDEAPRHAILVLDSDHFVAPLLYVQRVERRRPDVVVVIRGLMSSAWYVRLLAAQHRDLRPYAIAGAGGREGRIARLLVANAARPIRVEHPGLAAALGLSACPSGILWIAGPDCEARPALVLAPLYRIAARAHRLPAGALDGHAILGAVTYRLGLDLQRAGRSRDAYALLVAGLPDDYRGRFLPPPDRIPEGLGLEGGDPVFAREAALADPARNAFVTAHLLARAGQIDAAVELTRRAADDGLPEAIELLSRASR